jgi:hypothetical protein
MNRKFAEENRASTEELKMLVAGLRGAGHDQSVGNGWTVATMLCHMAMWDGRVEYALKEWKVTGRVPTNIAADATDFINRAARDVFAAVPGRAAAELAVKKAEELDAFLGKLDDAFCEQVVAAGFERMLRRSLHRRKHLDQMRDALSFESN